MTTHKEWIVTYHEHDSLLENRPEEDLNEEERERAWEEYEREKQGLQTYHRATVNYQYQMHNSTPALMPGVPGAISMQRSLLTGTYVVQQHNAAHLQPPPRRVVIMPSRPGVTFQRPPTRITIPTAQKPTLMQQANLPKVVQEIMKYVSLARFFSLVSFNIRSANRCFNFRIQIFLCKSFSNVYKRQSKSSPSYKNRLKMAPLC